MTVKKQAPNPVPQSGRDAFALHVEKWQDALNLNDWRIHASSKPASKANMAEIVEFDLEARMAVYRVGSDFGGTPVTDTSLEHTALHEVLHVLLHELIEAAQDRSVSAETLNGIEHRVIHTLVRALVP